MSYLSPHSSVRSMKSSGILQSPLHHQRLFLPVCFFPPILSSLHLLSLVIAAHIPKQALHLRGGTTAASLLHRLLLAHPAPATYIITHTRTRGAAFQSFMPLFFVRHSLALASAYTMSCCAWLSWNIFLSLLCVLVCILPERGGNIIFRRKFNASRFAPNTAVLFPAQNHNTLSWFAAQIRFFVILIGNSWLPLPSLNSLGSVK